LSRKNLKLRKKRFQMTPKPSEGQISVAKELEKVDDLSQREKELKTIEYVLRLERPIESKNRSLRKMNKSFKFALNYLMPEARPDRDSSQMQIEKKGPATLLQKINTMSSSLKESRPIIIVAGAHQAGNLWIGNARSFLENGVYKEGDPSHNIDKSTVSVKREIQGKIIAFDVTCDLNQIKIDDSWDRVVAVFVSGFPSQFQGWPDGDRLANLFNKMRAFFMKYHDVPLLENIKKWNVRVLTVNRTQRFTDVNQKNQFWEELENFLLRPISS